MAFFLQGKRNTDFPVKNNPSPFEYKTARTNKKVSHGYAPFSSTTKLNRTMEKHQIKQPENKLFAQNSRQLIIDNETFQAMAQDKMASMFKSRSQRFINSQQNVPGPGAYQIASKNKGKKSMNRQLSTSTIQKKPAVPSIPIDNLGYKYDRNNKIHKVQSKPTQPPIPGSYELRKNLIKQNGISWKGQRTASKKQKQEPIPGPGQYTTFNKQKNNAPTSCFDSTIDRFNEKKIKKTYQPGPGDYNPIRPQPFKPFIQQSHFNTKAMRFRPETFSTIGPGSYIQNRSKSTTNFTKSRVSQNKIVVQPTRNTMFSLNNKTPGPGQYMARDGMTFQLQKALLRKHNLSQFPNSKRQVFIPQEQSEPGPGFYNPEIPSNNTKGKLGYKKIQVVNLKEGQQEIGPSPMDYTCSNFTISKKIQESNRKLTLTEKKAFDSGEQRFKHYKNGPAQKATRHMTFDTDDQSVNTDRINNETGLNFEESSLKKTKKLIMTSVKVKVPFGSSSNKYLDKEPIELCPGYYDANINSSWLKPTFSIKGKIQN